MTTTLAKTGVSKKQNGLLYISFNLFTRVHARGKIRKTFRELNGIDSLGYNTG